MKKLFCIEGYNFPQYGDTYVSIGPVRAETNGQFRRKIIDECGNTFIYGGDCRPSGQRWLIPGEVMPTTWREVAPHLIEGYIDFTS